MAKYEKGKIIKGTVTCIEPYGAFVSFGEFYNGLIHISEISRGYVRDINDFVKVGDHIYTEILEVDEEEAHLKLSIKNIQYCVNGKPRKRKIIETVSGFNTLAYKLPTWIKENLDYKNIRLFNEYNYGSYLIYEGIPVMIDSRCDLYMPEFNEGVNVFKDFLKIDSIGYTDMEAKMNEYQFTHYLIRKNSKLQVYFEAKGENFYQLIYPLGEVQDNTFCIYERIGN